MRFERTVRLYGTEKLERLHNAHVCIVGIGGVGSWACESLARSGVGHLTLIDMDDICDSNINRQIHALDSTIGQRKAQTMAARIKDINPECEVNFIDDFVSKENIPQYMDKNFDYVLDAIDSVQSKAALVSYCRHNKIKVITSGGAGGQYDPTQVQVCDLSKTVHDPLASKMRAILRKDYGFTSSKDRKFGVSCVFSTEQLEFATEMDNGIEKRVFGTSMMVTASFGLVAAAHIVKRLLQD